MIRHRWDGSTAYDFARQPDVVVIALGTNDIFTYSNKGKTLADVKQGFKDMLALVREKNPQSKIVWIYNMMTSGANDLITSVISEAGGEEKGYYSLRLTQNRAGGNGHPYYTAHAVMAEELSVFLRDTVLDLFTPGDLNDDDKVDIKDVVTQSKVAAGWDNVSCVEEALDPNGDKKVNLNDVVHLARYIEKWEGIELSTKAFNFEK